VKLVPASLRHCGPIATKMRAMDRMEAEALGRSPKEALRNGLRLSLSAFTAMDGDKPVAMLGVVPAALMGGKGIIWMLGTDEVFRNGRALLTLAPPVLNYWLETFSVLENIVAVENTAAIRCLRRWGFKIGDRQQVHSGVAFVPFRLERAAIQAETQAA